MPGTPRVRKASYFPCPLLSLGRSRCCPLLSPWSRAGSTAVVTRAGGPSCTGATSCLSSLNRQPAVFLNFNQHNRERYPLVCFACGFGGVLGPTRPNGEPKGQRDRGRQPY